MMERTDLVSVVNLDFDYAHKQVLKAVSFGVKRGTILVSPGILGVLRQGQGSVPPSPSCWLEIPAL
jgi:ABC-type transporter Mla maintaining outer membrane lipid asymmetry ATPase subunit MlaF